MKWFPRHDDKHSLYVYEFVYHNVCHCRYIYLPLAKSVAFDFPSGLMVLYLTVLILKTCRVAEHSLWTITVYCVISYNGSLIQGSNYNADSEGNNCYGVMMVTWTGRNYPKHPKELSTWPTMGTK